MKTKDRLDELEARLDHITNRIDHLRDALVDNIEEVNKLRELMIKDENIRKAVRAWAEINSIEKVLYAERPDRSLCCLTDMGEDDYAIEFVGWIPTLKDGEEYTIAELCDEEKK